MLEDIKIAIVGLGYVGLPLAVEFSRKYQVVGYDINKKRINELKNGYDRTNELLDQQSSSLKNIFLTNSERSIENSNVYIITVPTPVDKNKVPNLDPLKSATRLVGKFLCKNNYVIYESTVYPGCTEEVCVPILEKLSGLKYNTNFFCGYSPERINPGDKKHNLKNIVKVTSGSNLSAASFIDKLYKSIIQAGTYKASSIAVAEAAKVIENTQRDVNIALVNELSMIFKKLNLDTMDILETAGSKWNFQKYKPGMVGGHCIGVDPYYLTHKAVEVGYHPEIILAGRKINDNMSLFISNNTIIELTKKGINPIGARIGILGLSFKEDCPDLRNTKVIEVVNHLRDHDCKVSITDAYADPSNAKERYGIDLVNLDKILNQDAIIISVSHRQYKNFSLVDWEKMLNPNGLIIDVKSLYKKSAFVGTNFSHWRL